MGHNVEIPLIPLGPFLSGKEQFRIIAVHQGTIMPMTEPVKNLNSTVNLDNKTEVRDLRTP